MLQPTKRYCVIYRTGGTENYTWHRSNAMSLLEASEIRNAIQRAGYTCIIEEYRLSVAIGLPEGYSYDSLLNKRLAKGV